MKILIVDDEEMIRAVLREYVEFEGNEAFEAADGMEAVKLCREKDYDLVLMDVMMPHLDGFSAVKEIKKEVGSDVKGAQELAKLNTERMFAELTKGQDKNHPTITPEQLANAVSGSIAGAENVDADKLNDFSRSLQALIQSMADNHGSDADDQ